jgi:hypothetical protein
MRRWSLLLLPLSVISPLAGCGSDSDGDKASGGSSSTGGSAPTGGVANSGGVSDGGGSSATGGIAGAATTGGASSTGGAASSVSVLQHHNNPSRDGVYVDAALTFAAAATLHIDTTFADVKPTGKVYAQPLYLAGAAGKPDTVIVATEANQVYAFDAATGAQVWNKALGAVVSSGLPCGNIANNGGLGITGTPVIDAATRTLYVNAMTADPPVTAKHMIHALDADTGTERSGWPVDVDASASFDDTTFDSVVQNQRGALALIGGKVVVPYGGHAGDCKGYHGWLVGVSTTDPSDVTSWSTRSIAGGVWASSGPASDGTSLFFATGNAKAMASDGANTSPSTWGDGETVYKFGASLTRPADTATTDYFVPANWAALDRADLDVGGTSPMIIDVAGATPSKLVMALGKDGNAYLLDREALGGRDAAAIATLKVDTGAIINASVAYTTATASYVVFKNGGKASGCPSGQSGGLSAISISKGSPPALAVAWCGGPATSGSPAVSLSNTAAANPIVWVVGNDNKLHGVDGDTGTSVFDGGDTAFAAVQSIQTPIVANGRVFVASNSQVYALAP